jgi:plasmid stabilization system protein ParE
MVPWQVVDGAEAAARWAHTLRTAVRPNAGFTSISGAIDFCHDHLLRLAPPAARRVIDIVADGQNNDGGPVAAARDRAVAAGITINGLPVLANDPLLDDYFEREVVGGPACFVLAVRDTATLMDAIRRKLLAEIA